MSCRRVEQCLGGGVERSERLNGGEGGSCLEVNARSRKDLHLVMNEDF